MPRMDHPETLENLISLVRENPVIYNPTNPNYKDILIRKNIWASIRDAMGIAGSDETLQQMSCRKIIQRPCSLRGGYKRKYKMFFNTLTAGAAIYIRVLFFY